MYTNNTIIQKNILHVDLTNMRLRIENPGEEFYRKFLGGRGIALHYIMRELDPTCDPLSPVSVIVFAPGLLNGIPGPGVPKYSVVAKSPLTGGIGESEAGGFWGPTLRLCGFDAIVVKGKAPEPVYLVINEGETRFEDAKGVWLLDTKAFQEKVHEQYPKSRILQIGPAGTNQVLFANITNDLSFFNGRNGLGAVMGSKNLKAIVLSTSRKSIEVPDIDGIRKVAREASSAVKENPLSKALNDLGTAGGIVPVNSSGALPTKNWTQSEFAQAEQLGGERLRNEYMKKRHGCFACPVRCKRVVEVNEEHIEVDPAFGGPEYESIAALGPMCDIADMAVVCKANELCNKYGIDTISTGATIAFAMQCFEEGLISEKEIGYDLSFRNKNSLLKMIEEIAYRRGYGDILALGSYRAAERIGGKAKEFCHHSRRQELPMHDPRVKTGLAFQYALSPRGADHWVAQHDPFFASDDSPGVKELAGIGITSAVPNVDLSQTKVRFFYYTNMLCSAYDILGVCTLAAVARSVVRLDQILGMARSATGWNLTWYEIMKCGERANNMARLFNIKAGVGVQDDRLPPLFTKNMKGGPRGGSLAIDRVGFDKAIKAFYKMAGWDQQGIPTKSKLAELEIDEVSI